MKRWLTACTLVGLLVPFGSPDAQTICGTWRPSPTPSPNELFSHFLGVAANSANDAWAVGEYDSLAGTYTPMMRAVTAHWNGSVWTNVPSPSVGVSGTTLTGVAATATTGVWAVGYSNNYGTPQTLIQRWNGAQWSVVPSPIITGGSSLEAITRLSATDLWAVGNREGGALGTTVATLTVHWNGSAWSAVPSPNVGNRWNDLAAVSGVSAGDVWAVGSWRNISGLYQNLAIHWNGTQWTIVPTPNLAGAENQLAAVVAIAGNDAWALGSSNDGITARSVYLHWNGAAWSSVPGPGGGAALAGGDALVALAPNDVWAIGSTLSHWDGSVWTLAPNPDVPGALGIALKAGAKVGACDIWAAGSSFDFGTQRTLAVRLTPGGGAVNQPPVAVATATPSQGLAPLSVQLSSAGSHDPDGTIVSYRWNFGDSTYPPEQTEANPVHTYVQTGPLTYHAELQVIDDRGAIATTSVMIHIDTPVHVESQDVRRVAQNDQWAGENVVRISDAHGQPISGATVSASYDGPTGGSASGATNAEGKVTLRTLPTGSATTNWCFTVTDVTGSGTGYVPGSNVVTIQCEPSALDVPTGQEAKALVLNVAPNPFSQTTEIHFILPAPANVSVQVVDAAGRLIRDLRREWLPAGPHDLLWDGIDARGAASHAGLYFVRVVADGNAKAHRLLRIR